MGMDMYNEIKFTAGAQGSCCFLSVPRFLHFNFNACLILNINIIKSKLFFFSRRSHIIQINMGQIALETHLELYRSDIICDSIIGSESSAE